MTPAKNLIHDLGSHAVKSSDGELHFSNSVCVKIIEESPNTVRLESIFSSSPLKGSGTKIMNLLISIADIHRVDILLAPMPFGHRALGPMKLISWYRKIGFHPCENGPNTFIKFHK